MRAIRPSEDQNKHIPLLRPKGTRCEILSFLLHLPSCYLNKIVGSLETLLLTAVPYHTGVDGIQHHGATPRLGHHAQSASSMICLTIASWSVPFPPEKGAVTRPNLPSIETRRQHLQKDSPPSWPRGLISCARFVGSRTKRVRLLFDITPADIVQRASIPKATAVAGKVTIDLQSCSEYLHNFRPPCRSLSYGVQGGAISQLCRSAASAAS